MDKDLIKKAEKKLSLQDPILGRLISTQTLPPRHRYTDNYFAALCRSMIGQQVSVAAASAIFKRFEDTTGLEPAAAATLSDEDIKKIGLSRQKVTYIKDLARHFVEDPDIYTHLETQNDEQVIAELTAVKGIGVWTAKMFLMFTLLRPDVFAYDDIGLQRAMINLYKWKSLPSRQELEKTAEEWKPYRTIACLHLWHSLDSSKGAILKTV